MGRAKSKMIEWEAEGSMHPFKGDKKFVPFTLKINIFKITLW